MNIEIANTVDIEGVLALQEKNLVTNLSEEEQKNGFVTTPFTINQLQKMIDEKGLFVAKDADKIVAYVCTGSWQYFSEWEMFRFMAARYPIETEEFGEINTQNSFQYGPICIDSDYRGGEILKNIFSFMKEKTSEKYPIGVTFINKINIRSYKAHVEKLGIKVISEFQFNNKNFHELAFFTN